MLDNLNQYIENAPILAIVLSYLGGVLTSFTPCVFPVIPITISVFGAQKRNSKVALFFLIMAYILGMAIVYAGLGIFAAFSGQFFGSISVHHITNFIIANVCIIFALVTLDVINIPIPKFFTHRNSVYKTVSDCATSKIKH